jgi:D-beta-D-heptose 7-phosphate kinase / D-beta-D-heptose 1-phosphate adenosyltransferase
MSLQIPDLGRVGVLVAGDVMLDEYWFGPTSRISPEAPVPVVRVTQSQSRAGGAANVAVNVAALGAKAFLTGIVGKDAGAATLRQELAAQGIQTAFVESPSHPTITKLRVLSRNQQLIRLDTEEQYDASDRAALPAALEQLTRQAGVCVLSDYAKGTLTDVSGLIATLRPRMPVLVDPKGTDFARYRGATLLTPNLGEFEAVAGHSTDNAELARRAEMLRAELNLDAMVVTLGDKGMAVIAKATAPLFLPARARQVYDVTGAGDTVIATLAAGLGAGMTLADAAALANLAAGLVVGKIGVATVTTSELRSALHEHGQGGRGLLARAEAPEVAAETRARGERLVMTNGCFDILHAGHVAYLEEAKRLGDRLLVAVNDDASVARLKGAGRPINPLADRMAVLAGLAAVDWVVPFSEDTPAALIGEVLPDVLVKGGDYRPDDIAGADVVKAHGGTVQVLEFLAGRSTTAIVDAARRLARN